MLYEFTSSNPINIVDTNQPAVTTKLLQKLLSRRHLPICACEELGIITTRDVQRISTAVNCSAVFDRMIASVRRQRSIVWWGTLGLAATLVALNSILIRTRMGTLRVELSYDILLIVALTCAAILVLLLKRLLAGIDHLSASRPTLESDAPTATSPTTTSTSTSEQEPREAEEPHTETARMAFYQSLGFIAAFLLFVLFAGAHTTWASMSLNLNLIALAIVAGGFGTAATTAMFTRELLHRKAVGDGVGMAAWLRWSTPTVTAVEKAFAITGIVFALYSGKLATVALNRTALANIAAARGQLYQAEARLTALEGTQPELAGLFARVPQSANEKDLEERVNAPVWVGRAEAYWHNRLLATLAPIEDEIASSAMQGSLPGALREVKPPQIATELGAHQRFLWYKEAVHREIEEVARQCGSVEALYNFIFPPDEATIRTQSYVERRCRSVLLLALNHIIDVLDTMHSAFDYSQEQILRRNEYDTWIGYLKDMGPHPLLLVDFKNWLDQKYMSHEFFADINQRFEYHDDSSLTLDDRISHMTEYAVWRHFLIDGVGNIDQLTSELRSYKTKSFDYNVDPLDPPLPHLRKAISR